MSEIDPNKIRDIEDKIKYLEDCQEAICKHLKITLSQEVIVKEKGDLGFLGEKEKK